MHSIEAEHDVDCFDDWHHLTCHNYSVTDYHRRVSGPFKGRISARQFGAFTVSDVWCSSDDRIEVVRGAAEIRKDPRDHFMVFLVCRGEVRIAQDGRASRVRDGDLIIYDQARPFTIELSEDPRVISLTIPRPLMVARLPRGENLTARRIAGSSRLGTLTASVVRQLAAFEPEIEDETANRIGASALDILTTTLDVEFADGEERDPGCHRRLEQAKRFVLANLHDADMTIDTIAAAQNVAPRTLHRLFAAEGTTPIRWLWQQRLAGSYKALAEGHVRHVTDAALNFGFTDLSHFSRTFKRRFGCPPHTLVRR
jgi:AraC-like DNA-binding protein